MAEATATSSSSALATRPSATATFTGAWPTARPARLSVVTAYSPMGAAVEKPPSLVETARTTEPDCSSMNATVDAGDGTPFQPHHALDRPHGGRRGQLARGHGEKQRQKSV